MRPSSIFGLNSRSRVPRFVVGVTLASTVALTGCTLLYGGDGKDGSTSANEQKNSDYLYHYSATMGPYHRSGSEKSPYSNNPKYIEKWSYGDASEKYKNMRASDLDVTLDDQAEFIGVVDDGVMKFRQKDGTEVKVRNIGLQIDNKKVKKANAYIKEKLSGHNPNIYLAKDPQWPDKDAAGVLYRHILLPHGKTAELIKTDVTLANALVYYGYARFYQPVDFPENHLAYNLYRAEEKAVEEVKVLW